jgi:NADH:ubiquinone oxidoreductase subunit 6 (subunit J)
MNSFPAQTMLVGGLFLVCLLTMCVGALIAVLSARLIRSVCGLAVCAIGLAGLYYFLHSPFLALMEILIYVGAVCVTIVFAVMLAEPEEPKNEEASSHKVLWTVISLGVAAAIFFGLYRLGTGYAWPRPGVAGDFSIEAIGRALLTTYSLAFELISLALLVAILGAVAIAKTGRRKGTQ